MSTEDEAPKDDSIFPIPSEQIARWQRMRKLSTAEIVALVQKVKRGDTAARDKLIEHTMYLVISIARDYTQTRPHLFEDAVGCGFQGLAKAVDKFDLRKGCLLSTYATWWIRQSIARPLNNLNRPIPLPDKVQRELKEIFRCKAELTEQLNRSPTIEELARETCLSEERIVLLSFTFVSLDVEMPTAEGETMTLKDTLPLPSPPPEQEVITIDWLRHMIDHLPRGQVQIRHFDDELLEEIALSLDVSPAMMRTLFVRSCERLKRWLKEMQDETIQNEERGNPDE